MRTGLVFVLLLALSFCVNSRVFYFIPDLLNWDSAQAYCRQHYTDLATVNDQAEYDELLKTVPKDNNQSIWIGLHRVDGTAPWVWSDLSTSTFRFWASGQPNNYGGQQLCVGAFVSGEWGDMECPMKYASVCYSVKKIYTVRLELKSSQNVNDPALKTQILLQIGKILNDNGIPKDAKLSWKTQPDGNVFQKKTQSNVTKQTCLLKNV